MRAELVATTRCIIEGLLMHSLFVCMLKAQSWHNIGVTPDKPPVAAHFSHLQPRSGRFRPMRKLACSPSRLSLPRHNSKVDPGTVVLVSSGGGGFCPARNELDTSWVKLCTSGTSSTKAGRAWPILGRFRPIGATSANSGTIFTTFGPLWSDVGCWADFAIVGATPNTSGKSLARPPLCETA